jgi:steroid delta-isomerase-like uncharacterized protein
MFFKTFLAAGALASAAAILPGLALADDPATRNAERYAALVTTVFNQGNLDSAAQYFAPSFIDHAPWPGHPADVEGFKAGLAELRQSFPDLHVSVARTIAQGDLLAVQFRLSGSHLGPFMGAPATGKTFSIEAIDIVRMEDGRIAEHWGLIDTAALAAQLGL